MDIAALATAFSTHDFQPVLPHIHDDVVWDLVGAEPITGKEHLERLVGLTAEGLQNTTVTVQELRTIADGGIVVVDTVTRYAHAEDGVSVVASCDLYEHADGVITRIRSYTVELPAEG